MKLLDKIKKHFVKQEEEAIKEDYYKPKLFGKGKTVEYKIDGMRNCFCKLTEWSNGEGYDIYFESEIRKDIWESKRIELHTDELLAFFACLNHFKHFD